ncbi:hypothetical protein P3X46_021262 [Hevea brasiliensis]|uniref:Uncharacterized protein n=1 Tax=Hevea brasiliensis TaxID=3981 RepID=A0ABQ9LEZ7_HEVBR|nr:uncharacterized protein LOC110667214 [Hevea brasiliensis]KAJ9166522.1 hypothetical protein P3X46_021262 [Hevea brasiliensis]
MAYPYYSPPPPSTPPPPSNPVISPPPTNHRYFHSPPPPPPPPPHYHHHHHHKPTPPPPRRHHHKHHCGHGHPKPPSPSPQSPPCHYCAHPPYNGPPPSKHLTPPPKIPSYAPPPSPSGPVPVPSPPGHIPSPVPPPKLPPYLAPPPKPTPTGPAPVPSPTAPKPSSPPSHTPIPAPSQKSPPYVAPPSHPVSPPIPSKGPVSPPKLPPYATPPPKPSVSPVPPPLIPGHTPPLYGAPTPFNAVPPPSNVLAPPGGNNHTTIIAVCVSLGGAFFLAFLLVGLICLAKKKKKPVMVPAAPVSIEEHEVIQETITTRPCGEEIVTVSIEDDVKIHEVVGGAGGAGSSYMGDVDGTPCEPKHPKPKGPPHGSLAKKKKKPVMVPAAHVSIEEDEVIQETITTGPWGKEFATVPIEDDVQIHEVVEGAGGAGSLYMGDADGTPSEPEHPKTKGPPHGSLAKKKKKPVMNPAAPVSIEEDEVIQEIITTGPWGKEIATVPIEDDVQIHEVVEGAGGAGSLYMGDADGTPSEPEHRKPKGPPHGSLAKKKKQPVMNPAAPASIEEDEVIQEIITTGTWGEEIVTVPIEDDVQIHEVVGGAVDAGSSYMAAAGGTPREPEHPKPKGPPHGKGHHHQY